jgi:hypothetical protein
LITVRICADRSTTAPTPNATATICTHSPISLPTTVSSADRRPTVSARLMVNRTLGPGMAISTVTTAANARTWLAGTMALDYEPPPNHFYRTVRGSRPRPPRVHRGLSSIRA